MTADEPRTAESKADFSAIYTSPDPRAYFQALRPLDYQVPQQARPVIEAVIDAPGRSARARTVLDVCCSYGINAALLRHDVDLADLADHYAGLDELSPAAVAAADAAFYRSRPQRRDLRMLGLDASEPAIAYAGRAGLLAAGFAEDLEAHDPSPALAAALREVGTIVCTGGVGYIGEATFARLLAHAPADVRLAVFVLRVFPYDAIAAVLEHHGLVTERLPGTFPQRRFADADEQAAAVHDVQARGLDPSGKEADGWFHAECWLSRPG